MEAMRMGNLKGVLTNLVYIQDNGEPGSADKLLEFIERYAAKGAQAARKHQGVIQTMSGGKWGIVREIFTGLKTMGLPRANKLIRATLQVSPSVTVVKDRAREIRETFESHLCPVDIEGRLKRAARMWAPLIAEKVEKKIISVSDRVPVTCGSDATPCPPHPEYCDRRNIILGLCGPVSPTHKCDLSAPVQIANGEEVFHQIVELVTGHVWASYVYTHILQPQVPHAYMRHTYTHAN